MSSFQEVENVEKLLKLTKSINFPDKLTKEQRDLIVDGSLLAWLAYQHPEVVAKAYKNKDTKQFEIFERITESPKFVTAEGSDAQAYILRYQPPVTDGLGEGPAMVLVARGTTSIRDWLCNAATFKTKFLFKNETGLEDVKVHSGFYRQFTGLFDTFDDEVTKHLAGGGKLICVGHSLGSAIACIASLYYATEYQKQVYYMGYGSPRCGNAAFALAFDKFVSFYARCKNGRDPVPACIPPISYSHVGYEIHNGPVDPYPDVPVLIDIPDHDIAGYVKALQNPDVVESTVPEKTTTWLMRALDAFRWSIS